MSRQRGRGRATSSSSRASRSSAPGQGKCYLNIVGMKAELGRIKLGTLEMRESGTETWRNIKNVAIGRAVDAKNRGEWVEKILTKESRSKFDLTWGTNNYAWDGGATVMVTPECNVDIAWDCSIGSEQRGTNETWNIQVREDSTRVLADEGVEALRTRMQQVLINAAALFTRETGGFRDVKRSSLFIPNAKDESVLAKVLCDSIDSTRLTAKDSQKEAYDRNLKSIGHQKGDIVVSRCFDVSVQSINAPRGVGTKNTDVPFDLFLEVLPRTQLRNPSEILLTEFLLKNIGLLHTARNVKGDRDTLAARLRDPKIQGVITRCDVVRDAAAFPEATRDHRMFRGDRINAVLTKTADEYIFAMADGTETNVTKYYQSKYGIKLKYPGIPLIELCPEKTMPGASSRNNPAVPAELLVLRPQALMVTDTALQQYATNLCRIQPGQGRRLSLAFITAMLSHPSVQANMKTWGITIPDLGKLNLTTSDITSIPSPTITYGQGKKAMPNSMNSWNMKETQLFSLMKIPQGMRILLVDVASGKDLTGMKTFFGAICKSMAKVGVSITPPQVVFIDFANFSKWHMERNKGLPQARALLTGCLNTAVEASCPPIREGSAWDKCLLGAIVAVPDRDNEEVYTPLKLQLEGCHGVITQMIREGKTPGIKDRPGREMPQTKFDEFCSKLALGVNTKFGHRCVNHMVDHPSLRAFNMAKTMFVGLDLTHTRYSGKVGDKSTSFPVSISAVVCSVDNAAHRYCHEVAVQNKGHDVVADMKSLFAKAFDRANRPDITSIVYLRDGVDFGSHEQVLTDEVRPMEDHLKSQGISAQISVLVVLKRHRARMYPLEGVPDDQQVVPGSACGFGERQPSKDHPSFFLLAHQALGGSTPLPARVVILRDDHNQTQQQWAQVLNTLAFLDQVVTLGVSLPTPIYYAHRLAERASDFLRKLPAPTMKGDFGVSYADKLLTTHVGMMPEHTYL